MLVPLLFSICEATQATTGFLPFDLTYGYQLHSLLDIVQEGRSVH